jgi:hypothetical protein
MTRKFVTKTSDTKEIPSSIGFKIQSVLYFFQNTIINYSIFVGFWKAYFSTIFSFEYNVEL